jgi:hypothetical protein
MKLEEKIKKNAIVMDKNDKKKKKKKKPSLSS